MSDYRDLVIRELADSEALLAERVDRLLDVVVLLGTENVILRLLWEREFLERVHADARLDRERQRRVKDVAA